MCIIVADKSASARRNCSKIIERNAGAHHVVREASTLHAILVLLRDAAPDFVIANDDIAGGDGVMLADAVRDAGFQGRLVLTTGRQPRQVQAFVRGDTHVIARSDTAALMSALLPTPQVAEEDAAAPREADEIVPLHVVERRIIEQAIRRFGGNIGKAADALEISPSTIYRKIQGWHTKQPA